MRTMALDLLHPTEVLLLYIDLTYFFFNIEGTGTQHTGTWGTLLRYRIYSTVNSS
jgi:hypothetical protein